jgi:hypothetical protein
LACLQANSVMIVREGPVVRIRLPPAESRTNLLVATPESARDASKSWALPRYEQFESISLQR